MDAFDQFWLAVRRFFFPGLLILIGLSSVITAISVDPASGLTQSNYFLFGGLALFILGIVILFFVLQKKLPIGLMIGLSGVLIVCAIFFSIFNYNSIINEVNRLAAVENSIKLAQQGLTDIQKLQEAHEREYRGYATSIDSLKYFAKFDSISVLTRAEGDIPSRNMRPDEIKKLGFSAIRDPKRAEVISEDDAIALELIIREYEKVPVASYIFGEDKIKAGSRAYAFDIETIEKQRTITDSLADFTFITNEYDSAQFGVKVYATPPYGPQRAWEGNDTLSIGDLNSLKMNSSW